jgi:hypothetical protein
LVNPHHNPERLSNRRGSLSKEKKAQGLMYRAVTLGLGPGLMKRMSKICYFFSYMFCKTSLSVVSEILMD